MLKVVFCTLLFNSFLLATGQGSNDTIILFDHWQTKQEWLVKYKVSFDALRVIISQDSFLIDGRKGGKRMKLNPMILFHDGRSIRKTRSFNSLARFSGIRIILHKGQHAPVRVQSIKTGKPHKWNNLDFDTVLAASNLIGTHRMLWNVFYFGTLPVCGVNLTEPCRLVDQYQMHAVSLPQMTEIRRSRRAKKKIATIEKTLQWEVNLVTGIITNYKTGEQRNVRNTN